ncbi:hypothetical protein ES703_42609 [subsurface metagenome]
MSNKIPEMLGEMDEALLGLWNKHVTSMSTEALVDYIGSSETYHALVMMRDRIDHCLGLLDELRLKVLPLLPDEEEEEEE